MPITAESGWMQNKLHLLAKDAESEGLHDASRAILGMISTSENYMVSSKADSRPKVGQVPERDQRQG